MRYGRVSARSGPRAIIPARRSHGATGLWWLQHCPAASATDVLEDGLEARSASPFVAELLACVLPALEPSSTRLDTDVLRFEVFVAKFAFPALGCLPFAGATAMAAPMASATELGPADTKANRVLDDALVA